MEQYYKIPTGAEFLEDKRINDLVYSCLLLNSFKNGSKRYVYKSDVTHPKQVRFYNNNKFINGNTYRNNIVLLIKAGLIEHTELNRKSVYEIIEPKTYIEISAHTLNLIVKEAIANSVKIYAILLESEKLDLHPTKKFLIQSIGYSTTNSRSYDIINPIIQTLQDKDLFYFSSSKESAGELTIARYLDNNNIKYKREYSFSDLCGKDNKVLLRFDFAIITDNGKVIALIEYDGAQHYDSNNSFYNEQTIKNDTKKNGYCKLNNYPLYRIKYNDNIKEALKLIISNIS